MSANATINFPFDSGSGANVQETQWRSMGRFWLPTGSLPVLGGLQPLGDSSGMQVKVTTGAAWIQGHYGEWNAGTSILPIAAVGGIPGGQERWDRVVCRVDFVAKLLQLDVLTGTPAVPPGPLPALTQSGAKWEILLADVGPLTNATVTITAAMVKERTQWALADSLIEDQILTADVASVTIPYDSVNAIPGSTRSLYMEAAGLQSDQATAQVLNLQFNGDTAANYDAIVWAPAETKTTAVTSVRIATLPPSTGQKASLRLEMPHFRALTGERQFWSESMRRDSATVVFAEKNFGNWRNTANQITSIKLTPAAGLIKSGARFFTYTR